MKHYIGKLLPLFALPALVSAANECKDEKGKCMKGKVSGDPHITTFSGAKYDCQGMGEFVLAKSLNETDPFQVNAFMVDPVDDNKQISVTRAVAFKVDPQIPTIRIKTQPGLDVESCTLEYEIANEDGTTETITGNDLRDEFPLRFDFTEKKNGKIKNHEIKIKSADTSKQMKFTYRDHDVNIDVRVKESKGLRFGCVININVCVNEESHPDLVGLLGTPNADTTDDWMTSDGTTIDMPTSETWLKLNGTEYCFDNHCVDDFSESMFDSQTWVNKCGDNNYDKGAAEEVLTNAINACTAEGFTNIDHDVLYDAAMSCKPDKEDCSGCPLKLFPDATEENDADDCRDDSSGSLGEPHCKSNPTTCFCSFPFTFTDIIS